MPVTVAGTQITFNDLTVQTTAALTSYATTYGAVGTYVIAGYNMTGNSTLAQGTTVAGSTLFRSQDASPSSDNYLALNAFGIYQSISPYLLGPTSLGLTGTWRSMTRMVNGTSGGVSAYVLALWVRVS